MDTSSKRRPAAFWTDCELLASQAGSRTDNELQYSSRHMMNAWSRVLKMSDVSKRRATLNYRRWKYHPLATLEICYYKFNWLSKYTPRLFAPEEGQTDAPSTVTVGATNVLCRCGAVIQIHSVMFRFSSSMLDFIQADNSSVRATNALTSVFTSYSLNAAARHQRNVYFQGHVA